MGRARKPWHTHSCKMLRDALVFSILACFTLVKGEQCFDWSSSQSVAGADFEYVPTGSTNNTLVTATRGSLIDLKCASVICPNPRTQDCFYDPSVCSDNEWCMLAAQELWGPWTVNSGMTPGAQGRAGLQCSAAQELGMEWWFSNVCSRNSSWGPYTSQRGRCVPFRQEQQSCLAELADATDLIGPSYPVMENGHPFSRPLRCAPGLVCTGEVGPMPHTCVRVRPPNTCFQGPWWNSTWCKVGGGAGGEYEGGLPQEVLEDAAASLILQLPQDHLVPSQADFWTDEKGNRTRQQISNIVQVLWPVAYRNTTQFPLSTIPYPTGPVYSEGWNATASEAASIMAQTPRVWSTLHTLIHNTNDPMSEIQVAASRSLAVFLAQNFQCPDCRGFWQTEVLDAVDLPPKSTSRKDHAYWWWRAHNMVSEHTAATRGGHPWIYLAYPTAEAFAEQVGRKEAGNAALLHCQNPFFLPFEDAFAMWTIVVS